MIWWEHKWRLNDGNINARLNQTKHHVALGFSGSPWLPHFGQRVTFSKRRLRYSWGDSSAPGKCFVLRQLKAAACLGAVNISIHGCCYLLTFSASSDVSNLNPSSSNSFHFSDETLFLNHLALSEPAENSRMLQWQHLFPTNLKNVPGLFKEHSSTFPVFHRNRFNNLECVAYVKFIQWFISTVKVCAIIYSAIKSVYVLIWRKNSDWDSISVPCCSKFTWTSTDARQTHQWHHAGGSAGNSHKFLTSRTNFTRVFLV